MIGIIWWQKHWNNKKIKKWQQNKGENQQQELAACKLKTSSTILLYCLWFHTYKLIFCNVYKRQTTISLSTKQRNFDVTWRSDQSIIIIHDHRISVRSFGSAYKTVVRMWNQFAFRNLILSKTKRIKSLKQYDAIKYRRAWQKRLVILHDSHYVSKLAHVMKSIDCYKKEPGRLHCYHNNVRCVLDLLRVC